MEEYIHEMNTLISKLGKTNHKNDKKCLMNNVLNGLPRPHFGLHMRRMPNIQLSELIEEMHVVELSRKALYTHHDALAMITTLLFSSPSPPTMKKGTPSCNMGSCTRASSRNNQPNRE